jgi:hypothetical protein
MAAKLLTFGIDTNVFLELLLALKRPNGTQAPVQRGLQTEAAIASRPDRFIVVQQVFYEALNKLMERERLLGQLNDGYLIWQRFRDLEPADKDAAVAAWAGPSGTVERSLLDGLRADRGLQIEVFPDGASPGAWFDSQRVFIAAHARHGPRFDLPDLVIVSQAIVARVDQFVTRDSGLRQAIEQLRTDSAFKADIEAINGYKVPMTAERILARRQPASPESAGAPSAGSAAASGS